MEVDSSTGTAESIVVVVLDGMMVSNMSSSQMNVFPEFTLK